MPSTEAKLLSDFLVAPASLRDFMTQQQFTDIFPKSHRANPAVRELYRELYTLREHDIETVRQDIAREVKRSTQLKRAYALERREVDTANVAGLDLAALQMEEEVSCKLNMHEDIPTVHSFPTTGAGNRTRFKPFTPASRRPVKALRVKSQKWSRNSRTLCAKSRRSSTRSVTCAAANLHKLWVVKTSVRKYSQR